MQGVIRFVSPSPSTLFHFPPEALLGKQLADVVDIFSTWTVSGVWMTATSGSDCTQNNITAIHELFFIQLI